MKGSFHSIFLGISWYLAQVTPGCPLAGRAGALLQLRLVSSQKRKMRQQVPRPACLPSLPTLPPRILSRGWAGSLSPSAPTRKMQHLSGPCLRTAYFTLHSGPPGSRQGILPLLPSWAKCTSSCPASVERPSSNLPATPCLLQQLLPQASASCLWEGRAPALSPTLQ